MRTESTTSLRPFLAGAAFALLALVAPVYAVEPTTGTISRKNFSGQTTFTARVLAATTFKECNFAQDSLTRIYLPEGVTFDGCNLTNCLITTGSVVTRSNTTIRENRVRRGFRTVVIDSDGTTATIKRYRHRIAGRLNPLTLKPEYRAQALEIDAEALEGTRAWRLRRAARALRDAQDALVLREEEAALEASR